VRDFGARELAVMVAMMAALVGLGIHPQPVLDLSGPVVEGLRAATGALP
jgi:NADH:ubiquinone oxidoreductase subunit 4 (subunit M)